MNKVILIGRLTREPEMRTTTSGTNVTNFTIAINRNYTNSEGEKEADFINCIAFNKTAENILKYCNKGSQVSIDGRIQTRSYDGSDGTKRYVTEVIVGEIYFLSSSEKKEEHSAEKDIVRQNVTSDPYVDFGNEVELTDDDLPF